MIWTHNLFKPAALYSGILLFLCMPPVHLVAQTIRLDPPGPREFVVDRANMLDLADKAIIQKTCDKLLTDKTIPLIVVTIESMGRYSSRSMTIEQFSSTLYNQWGIGYLEKNGKPWNKGILLLVSRDDRKARIELGAGYGHTKDAECNAIMQNQIISRFKASKFSAGIRSGVEALDAMAREQEGKKIQTEEEESSLWFLNPWILVVAAIFIFTIVSSARSGRIGLAWMLWGALFSVLGWLLHSMGTAKVESGGDGGGGSFSGGSFGGGFSGGGGATGSW